MAGTFAAGAATGFVVGAAAGAVVTAVVMKKEVNAARADAAAARAEVKTERERNDRNEARLDKLEAAQKPQNNFAQTTTVQVGSTAMRK